MIQVTTRIRANRLNKKGETRVLLVLYDNAKTKEISTGVSVKPTHWDQNKQRITKGERKQILNSKIQKKLNDVRNLINEQTLVHQNITINDIATLYKGTHKNKHLLVGYLEEFIRTNPDDLEQGTLMYYKTCLMRLREFRPKIGFSDIDLKFLKDFEKHLRKVHGNSQNTASRRLKVIKKICGLARRDGIMDYRPFEHFKIKTESVLRDYLTIEELKELIQLKDLPPSHELVRDIYIFSAFSGGMRFGDICILCTTDIKIEKGEYTLKLITSKSNKHVEFKLPRISIELINKYKNLGVEDYIFPILTERVNDKNKRRLVSNRNSYFNSVIKKLGKKTSITKHLTMHTARHTFATMALNEGISTEVVGDIMGHSDLKTTQIYTNILNSKKDQATDKLNSLQIHIDE